MRVAIFFDGKNFYRALQKYNPSLQVDYDRFARWVTTSAAGPSAAFVGAYYYTGHNPDPAGGARSGFTDFLRGLELRAGYFVKREPRVKRTAKCKKCKQLYDYRTEKRVDSRLVADMIQLAAVDAFDVAVLASGDQDMIPAVEALGALGKQVFVGVWPGHGLSRDLRIRCFGQVNFAEGEPEFATGKPRVSGARVAAAPVPAARTTPPTAVAQPVASPEDAKAALLGHVVNASKKLPDVSRWYFENNWIGGDIPKDPAERHKLIDELVAEGRLEVYNATIKGRPAEAIRITSS